MAEEIKSCSERLKEKELIALSVEEDAKQLADTFYIVNESEINHNINILLDGSFYSQKDTILTFFDTIEGISLTKDCNLRAAPYIYLANDVMKDTKKFLTYIVVPYGDSRFDKFITNGVYLSELWRKFKLALMNKIRQILINLFYTVGELKVVNGEPCLDIFYPNNV